MRTSCAIVGICSCCPALQRVVLRCNALSCVATRCPARWMACRSSSARSCSGTTATPRSGCRHVGDAAVRPAFGARTRARTAPTHEHVRTLACAHRPSHAHARALPRCGCADGLGVPAVPDAAAAVAALGARTEVRTRQSPPSHAAVPTVAQRSAPLPRAIRAAAPRALAPPRPPCAAAGARSLAFCRPPPQHSGVRGTVSTQGRTLAGARSLAFRPPLCPFAEGWASAAAAAAHRQPLTPPRQVRAERGARGARERPRGVPPAAARRRSGRPTQYGGPAPDRRSAKPDAQPLDGRSCARAADSRDAHAHAEGSGRGPRLRLRHWAADGTGRRTAPGGGRHRAEG
jgi:hypothetical protein